MTLQDGGGTSTWRYLDVAVTPEPAKNEGESSPEAGTPGRLDLLLEAERRVRAETRRRYVKAKENVVHFLAIAFLPPLALLGIGAGLFWAFRGFSRG